MTTDRTSLRVEPASGPGYRQLNAAPGRPHVLRTDLAEPRPNSSTGRGELLLSVAHLSDLHVCDAQSPARVEFLDRWADPDSPILELVGEVGAYRAHEMLTVQVAEACVRAVNQVECGPLGGAPLDIVLITGDNTDNAQANELSWYMRLLEGGPVHPDSGDLSRYEGVADGDVFDERFWHPDTALVDLPRSRYGFPHVPGLLDACRAPFDAHGLRRPWLAVHGNHDRLVQGTIPGALVGAASVGSNKPIALPPGLSDEQVLALLARLETATPARS